MILRDPKCVTWIVSFPVNTDGAWLCASYLCVPSPQENITSYCVTLRYSESFVIQTALLETEWDGAHAMACYIILLLLVVTSRDSETLRNCSSDTAHSEVLEVTLAFSVVFVFYCASDLAEVAMDRGMIVVSIRCEYFQLLAACLSALKVYVDGNVRKRMLPRELTL